MRLPLSLAVAFALAGCGGSTPAPIAPNTPATDSTEHHDHHEHAELSPALAAFHDVLAPVWHDKSPERANKACAQAMALNEKASAVSDAELSAATRAFVAECEKEGRPELDAKLAAVHARFHALAEH